MRLLGWTLAVLAPLTMLGLGLAYVKLLYGPIPLHFLVEPIRQALVAEFDGLEVGMTEAALHRSPTGGFELRLMDLRLAAENGETGVRASEALVGLDASAVWSGRIAASRIVLIGPRLVVSEGELRLVDLSSKSPGSDPAAPAPGLKPMRDGTGRDTAFAHAPSQSAAEPHRVDLVRVLSDAMTHLRSGREAASHLRAFGVRNATLEVEGRGGRTVWQVPEMEVTLDHLRKRSVISGQGRVAAGGVPFGLAFRLEDSGKTRTLKLETRIDDLSLPALARNVPHLGLLAAIDAPIRANGELELTSDGQIVGGRFDVRLGRGTILPGALGGLAIGIDGGTLALLYSGAEGRFELAPSTIRLDGSWVRVKGEVTRVAAVGNALTGWQLDIASIDGALARADAKAVPIDSLAMRARLWPTSGASELVSLVFRAGGASIEARGTMTGGEARSVSLEGRIGPMDVRAMAAFWPPSVAPALRGQTVDRLVGGRLKGGTFRIIAGHPDKPTRLDMSMEAENIAVATLDGLPPVALPRVLVTREADRLEISVPEAHMAASPGRGVGMKGGMIVVTGLDQPIPQAEVTGRGLTTLAALADLAGRDAVGLLKAGQVPVGTDGKVEAQWRATIPVSGKVELADTKIEAKVRVTDGRIPNVVGPHDVTGAAFTIGATERAIDIKGELLLAGILAKANGQWIIGESADRQSPIVVAARLDGADRRRLGMAIDDIVGGEIPIEVQFTPRDNEPGRIEVSADLTSTDFHLDGLSWRKPPGRTARISFEVVRPRGSKALELREFKVAGDNIAIDGTVTLGTDGQPVAYRFPGFSLNVVSNLEVEGIRRADKVWDVKARGKTFDGSAIMRSLYAVEATRANPSTTMMDLDARIDTVIGVNDTTVRQLQLQLRRRGERIVGLEMSSVLDGGQPIEARLMPGQTRVVHVETPDAGQALKTIGFYTSMVGGKGQLRIHLDGRSGAERAGEIQVSRFRILGDPIVSELVQGADENRPAIATGKGRAGNRVVREEIAFDSLRGSFATGNGQVAIESLNAAGPLIGASVRGKMDFRTRTLSLGGTYVPLSGLNRALAGIPILSDILTGPQRDGIIGITFAVDGPMAKPNVIINPLSIVAPGLFREIFQMVPENPRVVPVQPGQPVTGGGARVRASQPEIYRGVDAPQPQPKVIDGWSSQSQRPSGDR